LLRLKAAGENYLDSDELLSNLAEGSVRCLLQIQLPLGVFK